MPSVPAQNAADPIPPVKVISGAIDRLEPSLRIVNIIAGCLGLFIAPAAWGVNNHKIWMIIALAPLILSACLGVYRLLQRVHRERRGQSQELPHLSCPTIAILDFILAVAHLTIAVGIYVVVGSGWRNTAGVILGTWLTFLLLIDFLIHAVLFLNALPKLVKGKKPSSDLTCPRCGFDMPAVDDPAITNAITEIVKSLDKQRKGDFSLLGRYMDDDDTSDFGAQGTSGRPSQDTL